MNKTLLLTAFVSASAFAQGEATSPPPQPPPAAPPPAAAPADAPLAMDQDPGGRVRWGVSGNLGWHLPQSAFTFGAEGRIGYQISNMFGAYAIVGGTVGLGFGGSVSGSGASISATALSYYYFGAIAELMLADIFYVGGGPVLANGGLVGATVSGGTSGAGASAFVDSGLCPGIDLRLGLGLGRPNPAPSFRRGGFNLGLNALILFRPDTAVTRASAGMGGASVDVTTNELAVTVAPMLMLGYDSR